MRRASLNLAIGLFLTSGLYLPKAEAATSASEYRQLGLNYRDQERYPEAIAAFKKSVELEPENLSSRVLLGWTLHRAGERQEAAAMLSEVGQINPFYVPAFNALGIVYLVEGQFTQAAMTHTWAAFLKPTNEIAYYNLSLALQGLQQYDWAIATAQEAAKLEPSNPHPLVALAISYWSQGDRSAAQQAYRQAITVDSRYRDSSFLQYLNEAGFSQEQIRLSKQVLQSVQSVG